MSKILLNIINKSKNEGKKLLAVLIDPDDTTPAKLSKLVTDSNLAGVDLFLVGGSLLTEGNIGLCIEQIKEISDKPVVIFPGSVMQVHSSADAILFLSLISGRNPELLIGQQVQAAPRLKEIDIEVLPTAYMLVNGGKPTTASYISNTEPIPHNKPTIAACTALAGEFLGFQLLYLDSGSGAELAVSVEMIKAVRKTISLPIIVGGGIRTTQQAKKTLQAGADMIVIGTAFEENASLVYEIAKAVKECSLSKVK